MVDPDPRQLEIFDEGQGANAQENDAQQEDGQLEGQVGLEDGEGREHGLRRDGAEGHEEEGQDGLLDPEPRRRSDASYRFQQLANQTSEAQRKADLLEQEVNRLRYEREQERMQLTRQSEEQRLAEMGESERTAYMLQKWQHENEQFRAQMHFRTLYEEDRSQYHTKAAADPRMKAKAPEVEKLFQDQFRGEAMRIGRETIYAYLRGMELIEAEKAQSRKPRKVAAPSLQRQETRAPNPRGSVGGGQYTSRPGQGRKPETHEELMKRLENVKF
jgi:hypothetical protein